MVFTKTFDILYRGISYERQRVRKAMITKQSKRSAFTNITGTVTYSDGAEVKLKNEEQKQENQVKPSRKQIPGLYADQNIKP